MVQVKEWSTNWNLSPEQKQTLLRALYDASVASSQKLVYHDGNYAHAVSSKWYTLYR